MGIARRAGRSSLLSADCAGLVGPAVLNGSPLSYWAGEPGVNPMRIAGGLFGGAWLTHLLADLGDGRLDGAWLVQNFENLKPEAIWQKYANLFANIDAERERFLEFERWWNGFYFLSREEILAIVERAPRKNIPLWCDDRRSSSQRGRSFNPWPLIEAA